MYDCTLKFDKELSIFHEQFILLKTVWKFLHFLEFKYQIWTRGPVK